MPTIISSSRTEVSIRRGALVLLIMFGSIVSASAQVPVAVGAEFRVNTMTADSQYSSSPLAEKAVAMDSQGNFVITWTSLNQDGSREGIYAQRYNSAGVAQGGEFLVNSNTNDEQIWSSVAMDSLGNFVITWTSNNQDSAGGYGVFAQRYNSAGIAQGFEISVNSTIIGNQYLPSIAMDSTGNFVITWTDAGTGVYAQRFDALGAPQGGEFKVNLTLAGQWSSVAMDATGNFVITWQMQDGSSWGVYARRYNSSGVAQGGEFQVNSTTASAQEISSVGMDGTGNFVITWSSLNQDGSGNGIYGQRYNAAGVAQGGEFKVNTTTIGNQHFSSVAMDTTGNFIITWSSLNQDSSNWGVYAQGYNSPGGVEGGEFIVNTYTADAQMFPHVATNGASAVIAWTSLYQDGSLYGMYAQRYTLQALCVEPPNTTMIAWYPFDETTGTTSANLATGNTGNRFGGPIVIPGKVGNALRFDGINDYVESPSTIATNIGPAGLSATCSGSYSTCRGDFSIDAWVRLPPNTSNWILPLVDKQGQVGSTWRGYSLWVMFGSLTLGLSDGGVGTNTFYTSSNIPNLYDNQWHHVAVTVRRQGSPAGISWYFDGVLISTSNPTIAPTRYGSLVNSSPLRIGSLQGGWFWFKGDIDELEIFNRELTQAEVKGIFAAGVAGKCKY